MEAMLAVNASGPVQDALGDVARFVPALLLFVLILLVGWGLATLVRAAVRKILLRVGFDRLVERGGVGRALSHTRFEAGDLLAKLVYYAILLFTLQVAFGVWGPNPVSVLIESVVAWLPRAAVAIVIMVVAAALASGARDLIGGALGTLSYGRLLAGIVSVFILGLGVIAALNQIGIATSVTTPVLIAVLATIAGILIVGVGGGLVRPMQQRWEGWLGRIEQEVPEVSERLRTAAQTRREEAAAEAERQRLAEAERRAAIEAQRQAELDRQAAAQKAAQELASERQADADRRAAVARQAELDRQEAARRQAEAQQPPTRLTPQVTSPGDGPTVVVPVARPTGSEPPAQQPFEDPSGRTIPIVRPKSAGEADEPPKAAPGAALEGLKKALAVPTEKTPNEDNTVVINPPRTDDQG